MSKETQTPQPDFTPDNVPRGPVHDIDIHGPNFIVPGGWGRRREGVASWQDEVAGLDQELLDGREKDSTLREIGKTAGSLDSFGSRQTRSLEDSTKELDSRTVSVADIEREGLVRIPGRLGEVNVNPLEDTPGVAPNGGKTPIDWVLSQYPEAKFAKDTTEEGRAGYRAYIHPGDLHSEDSE